MRGTAAAGPSPRAVAVGLAVVLVVLVVVGRLQQHILAPQPAAPSRPLTAASTTTIPPVPVAARIRVGADVIALAAGPGGVWALGGRNLLRVDPGSNRLAARIRLPRSAGFYELVPGAGVLWVGAGDRTVRVDAGTGRLAGSVRVQIQAAASDGLWSCTQRQEDGPGRLVRIDPRTLAETARIRLPRCPAALAAEPGAVWALDDSGRRLLRVPAAGGRVTRIDLPVPAFDLLPGEAGPAAQLAMGEGAVWVVSDQIETPTRLGARVGRGVVRIDPRTTRVTAVTPLDNLEPAWMALAVGAGGVWVGGAQHLGRVPTLLVDRIDPRSGRLVGAFTLARTTEGLLAAGHGSLWLATFGGSELLRLDPSRR
jgi:streptogramin lyase